MKAPNILLTHALPCDDSHDVIVIGGGPVAAPDVHLVDTDALRQRLREEGGYLP